jgi:hypothetical protein
MTGVEAVSNGVTAFREPAVVNARRTLTAIVATLGLLLGGIAYLCQSYGILAMDQGRPGYQSVLSQLVAAVLGRGVFYYVTIGNLLAVLCLSANTSFVDFPRVCRLVATDGYLPRAFATLGRRLVNTVGIVFLSGAAGLLLIGFGGITEHLIPLFAVGAFLAFTLSQAGMVIHWRRTMKAKKRRSGIGAWVRLGINSLGVVATGLALAVILVAKFFAGAWITVLAFPILFSVFRMVKRYYRQVERQVRTRKPLDLRHDHPPVVVVPAVCWNKRTDKALRLAVAISDTVILVHLFDLEGKDADAAADALRAQWAEDVEQPALTAGLPPPRLEIINTPYRRFIEPIIERVECLESEYPDRTIVLLVSELVTRSWWQFLLHNHRAMRLRSAVLRRGDDRLALTIVPWYVEGFGKARHEEPRTIPVEKSATAR